MPFHISAGDTMGTCQHVSEDNWQDGFYLMRLQPEGEAPPLRIEGNGQSAEVEWVGFCQACFEAVSAGADIESLITYLATAAEDVDGDQTPYDDMDEVERRFVDSGPHVVVTAEDGLL